MFSTLPVQDGLQEPGDASPHEPQIQEDTVNPTTRKPSPIALFVALLLAGYVPEKARPATIALA